MADVNADAPFVFEGTVKSLKSSNVASIAADNSTAIVTVDHVRQAPRALAGLAGKEITLRMAKGEKLKAGEKGVFSADALLFGENLAVQSRGHDPLHDVLRSAAVIGAVPVVEKLKQRVDNAQMVVSGRVAGIREPKASAVRAAAAMSTTAAAPARISEHEPFWQQAVIDVSHVHKGPKKKQVVVNFPSSGDVMWRKAPKFVKGQKGVFILHGAPPAAAAATRGLRAISPPPPDAFTALDPNDYQPPSAAPAVEAMVPSAAVSAPAVRSLSAAAGRGRAKKASARKAGAKKAAAKKSPKKRK